MARTYTLFISFMIKNECLLFICLVYVLFVLYELDFRFQKWAIVYGLQFNLFFLLGHDLGRRLGPNLAWLKGAQKVGLGG